ncbi:MAG TPA: hypothetical protein VF897_21245 [Roseiflexaceae bacterium]
MPKRKQTAADPVVAAREVAQAEVARRWPDLAGVEPTVTLRQQHVPGGGDLSRLGAGAASPAPAPARESPEYIFTFAGQIRTPDGYTMPRVARVTVDSRRRVVKATASK